MDRESWPELDKVDFIVQVTGCQWATAPFWFGRAFEDPPYFTYSVTANVELDPFKEFKFTCGVERWFIDERGVFLGANVWFSFIKETSGDTGGSGGPFDLTVVVSWEGMEYKGYFHVFPQSHKKEGPTMIVTDCTSSSCPGPG